MKEQRSQKHENRIVDRGNKKLKDSVCQRWKATERGQWLRASPKEPGGILQVVFILQGPIEHE